MPGHIDIINFLQVRKLNKTTVTTNETKRTIENAKIRLILNKLCRLN